jgi:hypothetical protein
MSERLKNRKKKVSVVSEISSETNQNLNKSVRVTFTMPQRDINELYNFIEALNESGTGERVTKSLVVRKALRFLYANKKSFNKIP